MAIAKPNHAINVSAYFDDCDRYPETKVVPSEVAAFTNTHYSWAQRYAADSSAPQGVWIRGLREGWQRAYEARRGIHINLNLQSPGAEVALKPLLTALSPFWSRVTVLELADEPRWTKVAGTGVAGVAALYVDGFGRTSETLLPALVRRESTAVMSAKVRAVVKSLGLEQRPLSVVYSTAQFPGAPIDSLDIVGIEAYVDLPGNVISAVNVKWLREYLAGAIAKVPAMKQIHLVPMAYSRNYAWLGIGNLAKGSPAYRNAIQTLVDIMAVPYDFARLNKRVTGLNFFSWKRASGSAEYKRLARQMKVLGVAACSGR